MQSLNSKLKLYFPLIKFPQTALLLVTGLAGYMTARCPIFHVGTLVELAGSLFLAISGSTVLNMWWDRDIDSQMKRTSRRPSASGKVTPREELVLGLVLSALGVGWALTLDWLYGVVVFSGLFFDVVVYTIWLKRQTCWSILWGGISGGMPILAGRVLGMGQIDLVGGLLALAVLFWIPTHILTFTIRYKEDYHIAGVPTFPAAYGIKATQMIIAISSVLAAIAIGAAGVMIGVEWGILRLLVVLSGGLFILALAVSLRPSDQINFGLFKYASLYMLSAMILISI